MAQVQSGAWESLEVLVRRYERALFGYALRILGCREQARDLFQDTFLRVFQKRSQYRPGRPFRPWLYQICLNLGRDQLRRRKRRPTEALPETPLVDPAPGPDELSRRRLVSERIAQAVTTLPTRQRDVFILAHYQQLSYPEISQILGLPVGTVKSRMFHAGRRLAECLEDLEEAR